MPIRPSRPSRPSRRCRTLVAPVLLAVAAGLAAGCSPAPFDATSAWKPTQPRFGRSYLDGQQSAVPGGPFAEFEAESTPVEAAEQPENPWARRPGAPVVSVCYGAWTNQASQVRAAARGLCPAGAELRLERQDAFWNGCPLTQPNRASFRCLNPDRAGSDDGAS